MKVCSFLPAATQMMYDMGLQHLLYGVTFECPDPAREEKKIIVRCVLEDHPYSSREIDRIFSAYKANGESLYYVETAALMEIEPDIIFTQDTCEVCQIDTHCTLAAVSHLQHQPRIIPLSPESLEDVFLAAITIATALGQPAAASVYVNGLKKRMERIACTLQLNNAVKKSVLLLEWMDPIYNCGHWIPYQIQSAGAVDPLGYPGGDSQVTLWNSVLTENPEMIVIAPCGFLKSRTSDELFILKNKRNWNGLQAVQKNQVYLADFDLFTQPSASNLVAGIELLAALFHPDLFEMPEFLKEKYLRIERELLPQEIVPM